jgi:2,3-bisphosphoglycerate-dependent phosphoglycerate mutase
MAAFHEKVAPLLVEGKDVLITAHGNTIRGMVKELDGISDEDIPKFEIQTGIPRVYEFDDALKVLKVYNIDE